MAGGGGASPTWTIVLWFVGILFVVPSLIILLAMTDGTMRLPY
jgi:hypothetical protein